MSLPEDASAIGKSSPISPVGSMNLLSLTFQRLQLVDSNPKSEELIEDEEAEASKERLRRLKQRKHEPRSGGKDDRKRLRTINLDEVAWHDTADSCWLVIDDYVYDCTDFLDSHPGGRDVLLEYAGRDATLAFIGTGHSRAAIKSLENYIIGELPPEERIFRVPGGLKIVGL
ncbi:hypothetical protein KM043_009173 [Ampulex compressa]|nr:hypothetical protein KM043_009173 [Ampulex compressa]